MTAQLSPTPVQRFFDNNGFPAFLGTLTTYAAGTTTPQATYVDSTQTTQNTNPIQLNARGECNLWLDPTLSYKFVLQDAIGNLIWTVDNINGALSPSTNVVPTIDNNFTLGSQTFAWKNVYVGVNHAPVLDTVSGNIGYYARTAAEVSAAVTPTNFSYPPFHAWRYGADPTGAVDSTTALTNWIKVINQVGVTAGQSFRAAYLPGGVYIVSGALPPITFSKLRIYGDGLDVSRIQVNGGAASFTVLQIGNNYPTTNIIQGIQLEGIGILRNSGSGAVTLLKVINTQYSHYRDLALYDNTSTTVTAPVTGVTQAASGVVTVSTVSTSNPFSVGQTVGFTSGVGMTQLNGMWTTVTAIGGASGAWTVTLSVNTSSFTAYSSGGTLRAGGVSLEYRGHENNTFENVWCQNVQPIIMGNPSGNANDGCDHTEWRGLEIQSSNDTAPLITVATGNGTTIANQAWIGNQIWLGGIYGFLWFDNGPGNALGVGGDLVFENIRREQTSSSSSAETIYIKSGGSSGGGTNDFITNVSVRDCTLGLIGTTSGGLFFDGPQWVTLQNINLSVGGVGVKMTARTGVTSAQLITINCNFDPSATVLTNMEKVFGSNDLMLGATFNPQTCVYEYTDTNNQTNRGMRVYEGRRWVGKRTAVANAGSFIIPGSSTSTAIVTVAASAGSGSIEGGIILATGSATQLVSGTTNFQASVLANKLSVSWSGGSSSYVVTNNLGSARDITVDVAWM